MLHVASFVTCNTIFHFLSQEVYSSREYSDFIHKIMIKNDNALLNPSDTIICLYGKYENNYLITEEGNKYFIISYHSLNRIIDGSIGFFNIKYNKESGYWVIFQYLLEDELELDEVSVD